jgi:hypothetical protein
VFGSCNAKSAFSIAIKLSFKVVRLAGATQVAVVRAGLVGIAVLFLLCRQNQFVQLRQSQTVNPSLVRDFHFAHLPEQVPAVDSRDRLLDHSFVTRGRGLFFLCITLCQDRHDEPFM